jgi:hypothetical protein
MFGENFQNTSGVTRQYDQFNELRGIKAMMSIDTIFFWFIILTRLMKTT